MAAHGLAKIACNLNHETVWIEEVPDAIKHVLQYDIIWFCCAI